MIMDCVVSFKSVFKCLFCYFQDGLDRKKRAEKLKFLATIFLNNSTKYRQMYLGSKLVKIGCICIHIVTFCCLFIILDQRFTFIGYKFITNPEEINDIFQEYGACLAARSPGAIDGDLVAEKRSCHLLQNEFYKFAMLFLWYTYSIGFIVHGIQITLQIVLFLTCQEKRWQKNTIKIDLLDFSDDLMKLRCYELFVLATLSQQIPDGTMLSFLQVVKDRKCRTRKWTSHIP